MDQGGSGFSREALVVEFDLPPKKAKEKVHSFATEVAAPTLRCSDVC